MDYELCKQLEEAGYPQERGEGNYAHPVRVTDKETVIGSYHPTLEELIEAMGDKFDSLDNTYDGWRVFYGGNLSTDFVWDKEITSAVAKAWLALQKPNASSAAPNPQPNNQ